MKNISSRDNPRYKELKLLATSSQARRKAGRTVLDGVHLCEAFLQAAGRPLFCVLSESAAKHVEAAAVLEQCESAGVECICLPDALYHPLSQVEHGVGLLFIIDIPSPTVSARLQQSAVLLDNLQDPGNLGSILRSAAAAGIGAVFCSTGTVSAWSPKVLRAGMGAHFLLNIVENLDLSEVLCNTEIPVLATSSHATHSIYQLDLREPVAWLFGHEGQGVADELLDLATHKVVIPHPGGMESLNVAASAAICFFEQVRQKTA